MNAPHFDFDKLPLKADGSSYIRAVLAEQHRVCDTIDARRRELEDEFCAMVDEMNALKLSLHGKGFFAQWTIRTKMVALGYRISTNRDMRHELVCARILRTYA